MTLVKIKFKTKKDKVKGFYDLITRRRVVSLPDDVFQVPKSALRGLNRKRLKYDVLAEEDLDHAFKTLRDSLAAKV